MNFLSKFFFIAPQNWETTSWLEDRPMRYKSAMTCIELHVANLEIDIATLICTGMAKRMLVSCLRKSGARVPHKYSKVKTSIRIRPLNSLALNEPNRFWSKNPGLCNPRSWAHKRCECLPLLSLKAWSASVKHCICCQCHKKILSSSLDIHSKVVNKESCQINKITSFFTSGSIFKTTQRFIEKKKWQLGRISVCRCCKEEEAPGVNLNHLQMKMRPLICLSTEHPEAAVTCWEGSGHPKPALCRCRSVAASLPGSWRGPPYSLPKPSHCPGLPCRQCGYGLSLKHRPPHRYLNMRQEYKSFKSVASCPCDWLLLVLIMRARGAPLTKTDGKIDE